MIAVHACKCCKALIDSGAAISLLWYSTYQNIEDSVKIPHTANYSQIEHSRWFPYDSPRHDSSTFADSRIKFTHNFVICDRLPDMEIIFGIDNQKKFSLSYAWDKEKNCYIQRDRKFLTYTRNCEQKATIGTVKSSLKIPPQHNGVVPIKIKGPVIKEQMAYFITDDYSTKGRDPNINIINSINKIKGNTSVNILVSNYTNKHITFNKGEYIGHLEPTITEDAPSHHLTSPYTAHSVTLQKIMAEQVQPDVFDPPHHRLKPGIQSKLDALLKEYDSQFAKDETSIRTTPIMKITIDTGNSDPVSWKPYPIAMKNYQWVKE